MPTPREQEIARLKQSPLASQRIKAQDMETVDMGGGMDDISVTTKNRVASQQAGRAGNAARAANFAKSPIGAFQERMRTGASPLADAAAAATAVATPPDDMDLLGNAVRERDARDAASAMPQAADAATRAAMARLAQPDYNAMRDNRADNLAEQGRHEEGARFVDVGPAKRIGMGRQDEQMLEALGPEYAAEAQRLASAESATPNTMYAKINGQEFYGTPGQRVSRQALATGVNRIAMEKLLARQKAEQDAKFGQAQTLARIPGESAVNLAKTQGEFAAAEGAADRAFKAPEQQARIAAEQARTAGVTGAETRAQKQFETENDPNAKQRAQIAQARERLKGRENTPEGRKAMAVLDQLESLLPNGLPSEAAAAVTAATAGNTPAQQIAATQEIMQDPTLASLTQKIKETAQGSLLADPEAKAIQNQHIANLNAYVKQIAAAKNVDPQQIISLLAPDLQRAINKQSLGQELRESNPVTRGIDKFLGVKGVPQSANLGG